MFVGHKSQESSAVIVGISNPQPLPYFQFNEDLLKLGYHLKNCANEDWVKKQPDICILSLDSTLAPPEALSNLIGNDIPFIVSLKDESPVAALSGNLQKAVGFLFGEPSLNQLALEIEVGLHIHRERTVHSRRVERVSTKIQNNRDIGVATGLLMAQTHLNALEVFAVMKIFSRNARIRISAVAKEIIKLYELNHPDLSNEIKIEDLHEWMSEQLHSFAAYETEKQTKNLVEGN